MGLKTYSCSDDLREFGFDPLTGEACGIGMRILTDLNEEACNIWREFTRTEPAADNWNSGGVKSMMLPTCLMEDLWLFCHIRANTAHTIIRGGHVHTNQWTETTIEDETIKHPTDEWYRTSAQVFVCEEEADWQKLQASIRAEFFYVTRTYKQSKDPGTGIDNQHAFSGRTV